MIQIIDCLNMYQAELARVLDVQCRDIGELTSGKHCLKPETMAWDRALQFVRLYQLLFEKFDGEGAAMIHWMRTPHERLGETPHLLIVDQGKLQELVDFLSGQK